MHSFLLASLATLQRILGVDQTSTASYTCSGAPSLHFGHHSICGLYSPSFNYCTKMVDRGLVTGLVESAAGEWMMIISLVFGGCC